MMTGRVGTDRRNIGKRLGGGGIRTLTAPPTTPAEPERSSCQRRIGTISDKHGVGLALGDGRTREADPEA